MSLGSWRNNPDLFLCEGKTTVDAALKAGCKVLDVVRAKGSQEVWAASLPAGVPIREADPDELSRIAGYAFHRGVLAAVARPQPMGLRGWWLAQPAPGPRLVVIAPRVTDQGNVGTLVRNAAGLGADAIAFGPASGDVFSPKSVRASAGAVFNLPVLTGGDLRADLWQLSRDQGLEILATVPGAGAEDLATFQPRRQALAVLLGAEEDGLSDDWLALCHRRIRIEQTDRVESLNVAASLAVVLYTLKLKGLPPNKP